MSKLYSLLVALILAVTLLTVSPVSQASAQPARTQVSGCKSPGASAHWKFNVFDGTTISIRSGSVEGKRFFHNSKFRSWGDMKYIFCKDRGFNRVVAVTYKFCVRKLDGDQSDSRYHEGIHGWWFDPYIGTLKGAQVVNPRQIGFHWNGDGHKGDSHCTEWATIDWTTRKWMRTKLQPYWVVNGHVDLRFARDKHFKFVKDNSRFRRLVPHRDVTIAHG